MISKLKRRLNEEDVKIKDHKNEYYLNNAENLTNEGNNKKEVNKKKMKMNPKLKMTKKIQGHGKSKRFIQSQT